MVPTPQLPSSSGAAQPAPPAGKLPQKQAGDDEAFARLLGLNNASAPEAGPDGPKGSARAAQRPAQSPGNGQQAKQPPANENAGQPSGTSGAAQAAGQAEAQSSPAIRRTQLPASDLAFLARAFYESGTPPGAVQVQVAAGASAKTESADTGKTGEASGKGSQDAIPASIQIDAGAGGGAAVPAAQIQAALAPQMAASQAAAELGRSTEKAPAAAGMAGSGSAAERAASQASANVQAMPHAQALPQPGAAMPPASGFAPEAGNKGIPAPGKSGQVQAILADGTPSVAVIAGNTESGSQSAVGAPSKLAAGGAAQAFTVTDVRTYLAPEKQAAKLPAQEGASGKASTLSMNLSAVQPAAAGARQSGQPAAPAGTGNPGSPAGSSGGGIQTPELAVKPAAQPSAETGAAPVASVASQTASVTGQAAPPPAQQIFNAIQSAMPEAAAAQSAAQTGSPSAPAGYQPLKTITITLQPEGLGEVAIQLSLKANHLGVRVEASEAGTAQLLRGHDSDLTALLQSAGYTVSNIAVHTAPQQAPAGNAAQAGTGGQGAFNPSNQDGGGTGDGGSGTGGEAQHQPGGRNEQREGGYGRPDTPDRDKSLYV